MQANEHFQQAFAAFVEIIYGEDKWTFSSERRQEIYQEVFDALLRMLTDQQIAYDDFIESEILATISSDYEHAPSLLAFDKAFTEVFTACNHRASFLMICLQSKLPTRNISPVLLQACYYVLNDDPYYYCGLDQWLEALRKYPNPNAVGLVAAIIPLLTEDWYTVGLSYNLDFVLAKNPGRVASAVHAQLKQVTEALEAANRV